MLSIGVQNLRSLHDVSGIEIRPITVLLGKNSAGKSTFLRMFPLLKQSIEVKTSEPILWYGDYVDFGDFDASMCKNSTGEPINTINFSFKFMATNNYSSYRMLNNYYSISPNIMVRGITPTDKIKEIFVKIYLSKTQTQRLDIQFDDQIIQMIFMDNSKVDLNINGEPVENDYLAVSTNSLIPNLFVRDNGYYRESSKKIASKLLQNIQSVIKTVSGGSSNKGDTTEKYLGNIVQELPLISGKETILERLKKQKKSLAAIGKYYKDKTVECPEFIEFNNHFVAFILPSLLEYCSKYLVDEFSNVTYSKPLRADIQRYYRVQGLGVDEIDASGQNMPMFLNSLTDNQMREFHKWTKKHFGVQFDVKRNEGHVSLMVETGDNMKFNLADEGVGFSQVLPIITNLWIASRKSDLNDRRKYFMKKDSEKLFLIEQPELHIHPCFQAQLVDSFSEIAKEYDNLHTKIIFETHSETMLNRIGYLIAKGQLDPSLVNVVLFEKDNEGNSQTKVTQFDSEGYLNEWPTDFFSPERIEKNANNH